MKKIWFKAKRYGWGWIPCTWQGWLILALFIALVIANSLRLNLYASASKTLPITRPFPTAFIIETIILTALLIFICYKKGEPPHWSWGGRNKVKNPGQKAKVDFTDKM